VHIWQILRTWTFEPMPALGTIVSAAAYLRGATVVSRRNPQRPWPLRRTASFLGALLLTWVVLLGPIGAYGDVFFWAQMTQHIALIMVIAPLLLLGCPVLLLLRAADPAARRRWIVPVLRSRALRVLTDPVLTWLLFAGVLMGTHFSPFHDYALQHPAVQEFVEYPLYLGVALLYYYPLLGANACPRRAEPAIRVISLFLMMLPETMTGFFLYASNYDLYPFYAKVARPFGPGPIVDQQIGGALMWAGGMIIDAGWLALATAAWFRSESVKARRVDGEIARQIAAAQGVTGQGVTAPLERAARRSTTGAARCSLSCCQRSLSPGAGDDIGGVRADNR
jgi:cytochrome c oxidase assembly factor CtaG